LSNVLTIQNLVKRYDDDTLALDGISFEVSEGEFVAVIGPSVAVKSTLLRCINRLVEPTDGTINFFGSKVEKAGKKELRKIRSGIGMVFQHYNLIP